MSCKCKNKRLNCLECRLEKYKGHRCEGLLSTFREDNNFPLQIYVATDFIKDITVKNYVQMLIPIKYYFQNHTFEGIIYNISYCPFCGEYLKEVLE